MTDNIVGKITVESGNNKAIFEFLDNENITLTFEPGLDKYDNSQETHFVKTIASLIFEKLKG